MSNFEEKYKNWQYKVSKKTEHEKHVYALIVSVIATLIVLFFVGSNWYYRISGDTVQTSFFTDMEKTFTTGKENFGTNWGKMKEIFNQ